MQVTFKKIVIIIGALAIAGGAFFSLQKAEPAVKPSRNAAQVIKSGVAERKSVPITIYSNGYVSALYTVEVRPQTQNVVRQVHVREGQDVRAGQLLFTLDQRNDTSNVDKARAQVARDRADLAEAESALKRNEELLAKGFVSQAVVDTARNKAEALRGNLKADQAALQASNIALGNNQITASIGGRIGAISVHVGSLAQPAGPPMVTISQIDPISVTFSIPERELAYIRSTYPQGDAPVVAQLANKQEVQGKLIFIDNASDTQSGTIKMWPGSFVNVRLVSRTIPDAVVIPSQAIVTGPVDKVVYTVQPDDTVKLQKVEVQMIWEGQAVVTGIVPGTRVVTEGAQNLRPDVKVREMPALQAAGEPGDVPGRKAAPK
jgi:RND family efflux transporter MFP subunit